MLQLSRISQELHKYFVNITYLIKMPISFVHFAPQIKGKVFVQIAQSFQKIWENPSKLLCLSSIQNKSTQYSKMIQLFSKRHLIIRIANTHLKLLQNLIFCSPKCAPKLSVCVWFLPFSFALHCSYFNN